VTHVSGSSKGNHSADYCAKSKWFLINWDGQEIVTGRCEPDWVGKVPVSPSALDSRHIMSLRFTLTSLLLFAPRLLCGMYAASKSMTRALASGCKAFTMAKHWQWWKQRTGRGFGPRVLWVMCQALASGRVRAYHFPTQQNMHVKHVSMTDYTSQPYCRSIHHLPDRYHQSKDSSLLVEKIHFD
jgi:hypothetical protein